VNEPVGTLYLVGTPIGNLEDITMRALRVLREVPLIAAEDTRATRKLLERYAIHQTLVSYFDHNERARVVPLLERLREGDLALVSEAGMPAISDPGYVLVKAAIEHGIRVVPIPGPSAPVAALAASGLPTDQFTYLGFLPRRATERRKMLESVRDEPRTLVAFEAPHRLIETLRDVLAELGDRQLVVARELTKIHEEFVRGSAEKVLAHFEAVPPRGEVTVIIAGATEQKRASQVDLTARVRELIEAGVSNRDIVSTVSEETGIPRRQIYQLLLGLRKCAKM
jgi:16S rRNA (cytidine1402-2'-O)-methyltransferase